jgi:hypothetical protein
MDEDEIKDTSENENEKRRREDTEDWKAKFEMGEIPHLDLAFTSDEHFRMLHARVQSLEESVKTLDAVVSCLVCALVISIVLILIYIF